MLRTRAQGSFFPPQAGGEPIFQVPPQPFRLGGKPKSPPPQGSDSGGEQNGFSSRKIDQKTRDSKSAAGENFEDLVCDRMTSLAAAGENFDYFEAGNAIF